MYGQRQTYRSSDETHTSIQRRLILLSLDWTRAKDPRTPLGQASLLAALRAHSDCDVQPLSFSINLDDFQQELVLNAISARAEGWHAEALDLGMGVYIWNEAIVQWLLNRLRERGFRGRIILGGPQISYAGAQLEQLYPQADVFVRGYGEEALLSLVRSSEPTPIKGVHYAGTLDLGETAEVQLDELPSPWPSGDSALPSTPWFIRWETQRGCPYRCSFCQHREPDARPKLRRMHDDRLMEEIRLFSRSGVRDVAVLDPIFNLGERSVRLLQHFRAEGFRGRLSLQCRFESLNSNFLEACAGLNVHLEFGLQTIHEREGQVIQRMNRLDKVQAALEQVRVRGITFEVSIIFGLPEQTLDSFRQTIAFCLRERIPVIKAFPLQLLRGTPLERERKRWGLRENNAPIPSVIRSNSFDEHDWLEMARLAEALAATEGKHPDSLEELDAWIQAQHQAPSGLSEGFIREQWSPLAV